MKRVVKLKPKSKSRQKTKSDRKEKTQGKFYITTAIPYVNAAPHIGHALEFVQTDCIRRYHELLGSETLLATGADENSLKNVQAAEKEGITPQQLCDRNASEFKKTMQALDLGFDAFMRSSSKEHFTGSQRLWDLCKKDIYKKKYRGLYCVGCETFYTESELVEGRCPEHKREPELVEEENYFFRLSKYQKRLEALIETDTLKIFPESRKNEVLSFIRSGLEDFSVSRSKQRAKGWGVPVPGDPDQIVYVWFDALNVYQTAVGFGFDEEQYKRWWPCDLHVIGKGIIRFHAVYWPAILLSAGLQPPKALFVHGYITVNGEKISKSLGNVISPLAMIGRYGTDRLRYFLLRNIPAADDGDFSEQALVERANNELVATFSNLFYRITSFIETHHGGKIPAARIGPDEESAIRWSREKTQDIHAAMRDCKLNEALAHAMALATELNRYFQNKRPWETKDGTALYVCANLLKDLCIFLYPFLPETSAKALKALNCGRDLRYAGEFVLKEGHALRSEKLFEKIEPAVPEKDKKETTRIQSGMIPFEEFRKLDLRAGTITDVKDHPNAEKLYVLTVDMGTDKRQLVAAMRNLYKKEELTGKQVVVVCNLEPKDFRGVRSEGMLLAADDATLLMPAKRVKNGMKVR